MILVHKCNFTNILYEVYNLIKSPLGIIYHKYIDIIDFTYVTRLFRSTNTQFQYKQTLLYSVDTMYLSSKSQPFFFKLFFLNRIGYHRTKRGNVR